MFCVKHLDILHITNRTVDGHDICYIIGNRKRKKVNLLRPNMYIYNSRPNYVGHVGLNFFQLSVVL